MSGEDDGRRKIKLFCPSVSKILDFVACNNQKLDLGSIAAAFGLEPSTVKLNGHFISRGIDLVSSCVTWKSLLAFFSAKGLSTGKDDDDALLVHGKLSQLGSKRGRFDHPEDDNDLGLMKSKKLKENSLIHGCNKRKVMSEDSVSLKKLKLGESLIDGCNKRRLMSEDSHSLKKVKPNIDDSFGRQGGVSGSGSPLKCSFMSNGLKRIREDDMIGSASCKKIR